jgi:ABC-2 type transport system permease protein
MKPPPRPGLGLVALREIRFFRRHRAGYLLTIVVPLIAFAVLTWTFSSAVVRGLDVVVVDADHSEVSAQLIQSIASAPGLRVAERANDLKSATQAIRSGKAIAAVYLPPRFEQDLLAVRRPQIIAFYNAQYFTPGNIASRGLGDAISDGFIKPVAVAPGSPAVRRQRLAGRRAICSDQPCAQLRRLSAARGDADDIARRHWDSDRLCDRHGILAP